MEYLLKCYTQTDGTSLSSVKRNCVTDRQNVSDRTFKFQNMAFYIENYQQQTDRQTNSNFINIDCVLKNVVL